MPASNLPYRHHLDGVELEIFQLVRKEATSKQWSEWLRAPLEHAAAKGDANLFKRLMDAGADGSAGWRGCHGRTLIGAAVQGENERMVATLVQKGPQDVNVAFGMKESPLHAAAARGAEKICRILLHAGANPNQADERRRTPLHMAALAGHSGIVSDLLLKGAGPNLMEGTGLRQAPLHLAASWGHAQCVSELLLGGARTDALNSRVMTPIHLATLGGHLGVIEELCAAGCNLQIRALTGRSALDMAMTAGDMDVVRVLLAHGCDVNVSDDIGVTPLHRVAFHTGPSRDNGPIVRLLVEAGADVEARTTALGLTPLHRASFWRASSGTVRALLEAGANVNAVGTDGSTPLQYACEHSNMPCVEVLLRWGADETLGEAFEKVGAWDQGGTDPNSELEVVDEERRAHDECIRHMLERAPADRVWRRRGWLVLCRSCPGKFKLMHDSGTSDRTKKSVTKLAKSSGEGSIESSDVVKNQPFDIRHFVREIVEVEGDGVFRSIVSFL